MEEVEIDIDWFDAKIRPFVLQAFRVPTHLKRQDLENVALTIVGRVWLDPPYYPRAATLCRIICRKETDTQKDQSIPSYNFRNGLISACHDVIQKHNIKAQNNMFQWICFCHFIAEIYRSIRVHGETIGSFARMLFDLINEFCQLQNLLRFDQVELLHSIILECGLDLEKDDANKMNEVFNSMREAFLYEQTSTEIRAMLMQVIELRASRWKFSAETREYYFGS